MAWKIGGLFMTDIVNHCSDVLNILAGFVVEMLLGAKCK